VACQCHDPFCLDDLPERLRSQIQVNPATGCWEWTGDQQRGYGRVWWEGRTQKVHRVVFTLLAGPIPDGLTIDHVKDRGCRSNACCWPAHLEPVTAQENIRRAGEKLLLGQLQKAKTHCPAGHEYTPENTQRDPRGARRCRACEKDRRSAPSERAHRAQRQRQRRAAARSEVTGA
jgi:hypothetical protein